MQLRVPGPTPIPESVLQASARQMINHRGPEFVAMITRITKRLKKWFSTEGDVLILTASGTGGLEAAVVNTLSPGDRVLAVSIGEFGDRFAEIASIYGADVTRLSFPLGQPATPEAIAQKLKSNPPYKAVFVTHNETSTGITNDLAPIAHAVHENTDALLLVDAISSLSSVELQTDALGIDVVISGSQKGWMVQPGLTMLSMSEKAWGAYEKAKMPRFYFDLGKAKKSLASGHTPATPAVSLFFAMDASLELLEREGKEAVFARHALIASRAREGAKELGLRLFAQDERYASNTVTAVHAPEGHDLRSFMKALREDHSVILAEGQASLQGKIFRIGHLGYIDLSDMEEILAAIKAVLATAR